MLDSDWIAVVAGLLVAVALPLQALTTFKEKTATNAAQLLFLLAMLVWNLPTVVKLVPEGILWGLGICWLAGCGVLVQMGRRLVRARRKLQ